MGKFNVLGRRVAAVTACAALACAVSAPPALGQGDPSVVAPLARCWDRVETRPELAPCLEDLLREAEDRLAARLSEVERRAAELDRVTGGRSRNVERTRESDARWRTYREAECDRQSAAMSPGTGSGDVLLACRVAITDARTQRLAEP